MPLYICWYGHLINLGPKDILEKVPGVRITLGILQSMYNFLKGSTKHHNIFQEFNGDEGKDYLLLSLKFESVTSLSCRLEAVKAIYEQLEQIIGCLMQSSTNNDSKTYTDARSLLISILDFYFVFGLCLLRAILMNTGNLNGYVQGKQVDIFPLHKTSEMTTETLRCYKFVGSCDCNK